MGFAVLDGGKLGGVSGDPFVGMICGLREGDVNVLKFGIVYKQCSTTILRMKII